MTPLGVAPAICPLRTSRRRTHSDAAARFMQASPEEPAKELAAAEAVAEARALTYHNDARFQRPGWALSTVWEAAGAHFHPHLDTGRLQAGSLASLLVWDEDHPALWPSGDAKAGLVFCAGASRAVTRMMVAGKWVGEATTDSKVQQPGGFQAGLLRSEAFREHRIEASERLKALLRRAGIA